METDCFVLYNIQDLSIVSIARNPFEDCSPEHKSHKIKTKMLANVMKASGLDDEGDYLKFVSNLWKLGTARNIALAEILPVTERPNEEDGVVQDLNYRSVFFKHFKTKFTQEESTIRMTMDLSDLDLNSQFSMSVTENNGPSTFYISKYGSPGKLLSSHKVNINDFKNKKEITITKIIKDERISIWAARNY